MTQNKVEELEGIELLPHPPKSPDLLLRPITCSVLGHHFVREGAYLMLTIWNGIVFFASKSKDGYQNGLVQLARRWEETIEFHG